MSEPLYGPPPLTFDPKLIALPDYLDNPMIRSEYIALRYLDDGRVIGVKRLMFHWTMHVDLDECGCGDNYCFQTLALAMQAFILWDGTGDPIGWHKHPRSGRTISQDGYKGFEWHLPGEREKERRLAWGETA